MKPASGWLRSPDDEAADADQCSSDSMGLFSNTSKTMKSKTKHHKLGLGFGVQGAAAASILSCTSMMCSLMSLIMMSVVILELHSTRMSSNGGSSTASWIMSGPSLLHNFNGNATNANGVNMKGSSCKGRRIYMYDVPAEYTTDLADECTRVGRGRCRYPWGCLYCGGLENNGIGLSVYINETNVTVSDDGTAIDYGGYFYKYPGIRLVPEHAWFRTHQFSLEPVFHAKMRAYPCRTDNYLAADAFFVPFYAGQEVGLSMLSRSMQIRDRRVNRFMGWLTAQEAWRATRGWRHFMVLGRQPVDMNRTIEANVWGLPVISQPELAPNVTFFWWEKAFSGVHEIGVPYPTSFHPSSDADLRIWQDMVKSAKREWLVSYLGSASRKFRYENVLLFRKDLKRQCEEEATRCRFMDCTLRYTKWQIPCESQPEVVLLEFTNSIFCLQPPGDTPTRKSIFDSLLAGCIPVVFTNLTAHLQYPDYLPSDSSLYSVTLSQDAIVEGKAHFVHQLGNITSDRIQSMQNTIREVIIPRIIYTHPSSSTSFLDAMDVALNRFLSNFSSSSS